MPIPITHVRLIAKMKKDDGTLADVIVRHVHAGAPYGQRSVGSNIPAHTRYVTGSGQDQEDGQDIAIPWPADNIEGFFKHSEGDTVRRDVQETTWLPAMTIEPLGYTFDVDVNARRSAQATTPYTLGLVDRQKADNIHRAGLHGFISESKLDERRTRIARGILDELRPKATRTAVFHEDNEWVKRKMLEDARAIWWRDRKVMTPAAEAAERAQQERQRQREEQISKTTGMPAPAVRAPGVQAHITLQPMSLPAETIDLVNSMQAASLKTMYKRPDLKFQKRLEHMERNRLEKLEMMERMAVET